MTRLLWVAAKGLNRGQQKAGPRFGGSGYTTRVSLEDRPPSPVAG
jgi:hypothetical protein